MEDCKDEDNAEKKFMDEVGETLNTWFWDLVKDIEIIKIKLIGEDANDRY